MDWTIKYSAFSISYFILPWVLPQVYSKKTKERNKEGKKEENNKKEGKNMEALAQNVYLTPSVKVS